MRKVRSILAFSCFDRPISRESFAQSLIFSCADSSRSGRSRKTSASEEHAMFAKFASMGPSTSKTLAGDEPFVKRSSQTSFDCLFSFRRRLCGWRVDGSLDLEACRPWRGLFQGSFPSRLCPHPFRRQTSRRRSLAPMDVP